MAVKKEKLTFEDALKNLETITQQLERADIPLEEALVQFQKGMELSKYCRDILDNAEKTVTSLISESGDAVVSESLN